MALETWGHFHKFSSFNFSLILRIRRHPFLFFVEAEKQTRRGEKVRA